MEVFDALKRNVDEVSVAVLDAGTSDVYGNLE
jgi:hypothetical protein